jgi:PAS domain S-box-containing protein
MEQPLRVLIVEDFEPDAFLIEQELRRGGCQVVCQRVETGPEMLLELNRHPWDVIICDYKLPGFGALAAMKLLKELELDIPFLIVSGVIGEETAVAIMKAGAHDYVMKNNLTRLVPAVAREIRDAGERLERRKAEEQLRENEARFRLLFEDSPISLWEKDYSRINFYLDDLRQSGIADFVRYFQEHPEAVSECLQRIRVISVNKATLKMFKAEDQSVLQANFEQTFTPDSLQSFGRELAALSSGETTIAIEGERRSLAGETFFVARRLQVMPGFEESLGKVGVSLIDLTERKRAQEAVQKALARAEDALAKIDAIFRSVASALLVVDMEGSVILMNHTAEQTLGVTLQSSLNQPVDQVIKKELLTNHIEKFLKGKKTEDMIELEMFDCFFGEMRTLQISSSLARTRDGTSTGVVITFFDITSKREMDRAKSEFIMTAAHELRTPLTTIMGYTELLLSENQFDQEQNRTFLSYIMEKAEILQRIVDDLLQLGHIEFGRTVVLKRTRCHLDEVINRYVDHYRREHRIHQFKTDLPEKPIFVYMDSDRIGQVLDNLLSNSVKYSPAGGLISSSAEIRDDLCIVKIQDEGIGMSQAQKARAFEKFYRGNISDTAVGGLGLGLTITKNIVEAHGGRIWIESEPGRGTSVSFSLPLHSGETGEDNQSG